MNKITWELVTDKITLKKNEIHIWLCDITTMRIELNNFTKVLSKEEIKKANKFHFEKDRNSYIFSHANLRFILAKYLKEQPKEIKFFVNEFGKPFLYSSSNDNLMFNLSHSGNFCLIGITLNNEIGIDIEKINPDFSTVEIAEKFFSKKEYESLIQVPKLLRKKSFFNCWTRKEAFIKAVGKGLSISLKSFDVTLDENPKIVRYDKNNLNNWHLDDIKINDEYCAALVVSGENKKRFRYFRNTYKL